MGHSRNKSGLDLFMDHVNKTDTCWLWTGGTSEKGRKGYGKFRNEDRKTVSAHRYAYEQIVGPIPRDLTIDHLCCVKLCVNPSHLEPVTHLENRLRCPKSSIVINLARTHCPLGHPYEGDNLYITKNGWRQCVICRDRRNKERTKI